MTLTENNLINLMLLEYVEKRLLKAEIAYELALFYGSIP